MGPRSLLSTLLVGWVTATAAADVFSDYQALIGKISEDALTRALKTAINLEVRSKISLASEVSLASDAQIDLSPRTYLLRIPQEPELFFPLQALESDSVTLSRQPDDWAILRSQRADAQLQSITGPAKIRQDGLWTWLEVSDGKSRFKASWVNPRVQLIPKRTYTFTVLLHPYEEPSVEKIFEEGRKIYDLSVCPVHDVQMHREDVPVTYGGGGPHGYYPHAHSAEPSFDTRMRLFPYYVQVTYGGCINTGQPTAMLYTCPKCRTAFKQWEQQYAPH